jgi:hypothetical protein
MFIDVTGLKAAQILCNGECLLEVPCPLPHNTQTCSDQLHIRCVLSNFLMRIRYRNHSRDLIRPNLLYFCLPSGTPVWGHPEAFFQRCSNFDWKHFFLNNLLEKVRLDTGRCCWSRFNSICDYFILHLRLYKHCANTSFREASAVGLDLIWRAASPILEQPPASPAPASGPTTSSSSRWLVTLRWGYLDNARICFRYIYILYVNIRIRN